MQLADVLNAEKFMNVGVYIPTVVYAVALYSKPHWTWWVLLFASIAISAAFYCNEEMLLATYGINKKKGVSTEQIMDIAKKFPTNPLPNFYQKQVAKMSWVDMFIAAAFSVGMAVTNLTPLNLALFVLMWLSLFHRIFLYKYNTHIVKQEFGDDPKKKKSPP